MPTINANDLEIGYEVAGDGPPLVMLHAATSCARDTFGAQVPVLARSFRLYLPDARGHGTTSWDASAGFRSEWLVDDLLAFVDRLGLATFHLLGFSMGGMTALTVAAQATGRIRSLVVAGIAPQREPRASVAGRLMDPSRIERNDPDWAAALARLHDPVQGPGAWRRLLPAIAMDVRTQPLLSAAEVHSIDAPSLVMCGDRDPFVPVDQAWALARQLGDGRLLVVPDCPHDVMSQRAGIVNEALMSFYRSRPARGDT